MSRSWHILISTGKQFLQHFMMCTPFVSHVALLIQHQAQRTWTCCLWRLWSPGSPCGSLLAVYGPWWSPRPTHPRLADPYWPAWTCWASWPSGSRRGCSLWTAHYPGRRRGLYHLQLLLITLMSLSISLYIYCIFKKLLSKLFSYMSKIYVKIPRTFLTSLVSMQRSIRSTVEMSMYSRHMSFIHWVKLSNVVWKSSQVNFMMLNTRLMMLSKGRVYGTKVVALQLQEHINLTLQRQSKLVAPKVRNIDILRFSFLCWTEFKK